MRAPEGGSWWRQRALCADPALLPLVDAAFERPGGPDALAMRSTLCSRCPVADRCLDEALTNGEFGVWGATSPHGRTRNGGRHHRGAAGGLMRSDQRRPITL